MKIRLVFTLVMLMGSLIQAQTLKFGLNAGYPPFESKNESNEIIGFDVDIAKNICADLKMTCEFVDQSFDSLIPNLNFKRFDAIISAMDITEERAKVVSFTKAYYQNNALFVSEKDKYSKISELKGKKVGVLNGTTHQAYLNEVFKEVTIVPYPQFAAAIVDLGNQRIDAVFGDDATLTEFLKKNTNLEIIEKAVSDDKYFGTGLGIAVRKDNIEMLEKINASLDNMKKTGKYQEIYKQWFSVKN